MSKITGCRQLAIMGGVSGICGVLLLVSSFVINSGPPPGVTPEDLAHFAQQNYARVLWGAWMQGVGLHRI